jgi:hypothetical protein
MKQLFSNQDKKLLCVLNKSEKDLQQFICDNWEKLFPEYVFIAQEFQLKGAVHASGSSGRIDILAYNPETKRFVFFELKKNYDKNIGHQAANYHYYIKKNFSEIYVDALQKHKAGLPDKATLDEKEVEIILIATKFTPLLIDQAETENLLTLIEYYWFENDLVLFDYVHTLPDIVQVTTLHTSTTSKKNKYVEEGWDWDSIVADIKKASVRKQLESVPFIKENHDQLKAIAEQVPSPIKRSALLKLLEELKTGDASNIDNPELK